MKISELFETLQSAEDVELFLKNHPRLSALKKSELTIWRSFYLKHPVEARKIADFLHDAKTADIPNIEGPREIFIKFAESIGIQMPMYNRLYRGSNLYDLGIDYDEDEEGDSTTDSKIGDEFVSRDSRVSYWSQSKSHALIFVDEDDPAALISRSFDPSLVLFDLNILPYPGGNLKDDREPELLLRPNKHKVRIDDLFLTEEDTVRLFKLRKAAN